jgi:hypothetical protein
LTGEDVHHGTSGTARARSRKKRSLSYSAAGLEEEAYLTIGIEEEASAEMREPPRAVEPPRAGAEEPPRAGAEAPVSYTV